MKHFFSRLFKDHGPCVINPLSRKQHVHEWLRQTTLRLAPLSISIFLFFCLSSHLAIANPLGDDSSLFNLTEANQAFDRINLNLSVQNLNLNSLNAAINTLNKYIVQADQCMENAQARLQNIDVLLRQGAAASDPKTTGADSLYLKEEQKKKASTQAACRLFSIRAKEAVDAYKTGVAKLSKQATFARSMPLWEIVRKNTNASPFTEAINPAYISMPPALQPPFLMTALLLTALMLSYLTWARLQKSRIAHHYLHLRKTRLRHVLLLACGLVFAVVFLYLLIQLQDVDEPNLFLDISQESLIYLSGSALIALIFHIKRVRIGLRWYLLDIHFIQSLLLVLFSFYTISRLGHLLNNALSLTPMFCQLEQSLFLLSLLLTGIFFIYYFCRTHRPLAAVKHHHRLIQRLGVFVLMTCAVIDIFGFHALAIRLTSSGLMTFIVIFMTIIVIQGINKSYAMLSHHPQTQGQVIKYFGYKKDQVFTEFLILKTTIQMMVMALSLYLVVRSWGFAAYYLERVYTPLFNGIQLANTTIYPTRIVLGVLIYCLMYLFFRSLSTAISRHQQFEDEEETQVAIASILTYVGFTLALISALLVAGFNFTGLAIVAGALSVGIGLGLQSIVNNFVSGLILLIEKPIKPGDRINIDGVEGFVKKIRVRSTHLITPAYEDIIVPNSDLITRRVTNYVYSNKQCSINCDINVPNGCDTQRVRAVLLDAAMAHEDVIKSGRNKPYVLFRSFQEKTLSFQLCCLIKDVNKKLMVQSDLNFVIDDGLREINT